MTTTIVIDSTLIASIIAAAVSIITASGTSIWNTVSTRRAEKKNNIETKKEDLLLACIDLQKILVQYYMFLIFNDKVSSRFMTLEKLEKLDVKKDMATARIELIGRKYFNKEIIHHVLTSIYDFEINYITEVRANLIYGDLISKEKLIEMKKRSKDDYEKALDIFSKAKIDIMTYK